jgi:hypothetical protein
LQGAIDGRIVKNLHLPLPERIYDELRAEAQRVQRPATTVAREAISGWLRARRKPARRKAAMEYAEEMAGISMDLDPSLEGAAIKQLLQMDRGTT